jgi:predicted nucleic acid-binding protein
VLVDTSVWVDHFRRRSARLSELLEAMQVWMHPFVIGELACGSLARRSEVLSLLEALPQLPLAEHGEVLAFIGAHRLHGRGLGWIDMHLLVSARLASLPVWTLDRRLATAARELSLAAPVS